MRHFIFLIVYVSLSFKAFSNYSIDTIKLYFNIGVGILNTSQKQQIDSLIYFDKIRPNMKIGILGYCDYLGTEERNLTLSEERAKSIENHLLSLGIKQEDIQLVIGKGELSSNDTTSNNGNPLHRRVDIILGGIKNLTKPTPKILDIKAVKKNEAIRLNNIFFYPGRHKVREQSLPELQKLYQIMIENPTLKIRIEGHICCVTYGSTDGYDYDNQDFTLSINRAKEIYDYLINKKINPSRLEYKGYGKSKPLADPEKNEDDENLNRRVEIRILDK